MDPREETALAALGPVGPWQIKISLLMAFLKFPVAWTLLGMIFMGAPVEHHCVGSTKQCETADGGVCTKWEYNRTVFKETIATEWDLVCSRSQLVNFAQMSFMVGIMFGTILFSIASDSKVRIISQLRLSGRNMLKFFWKGSSYAFRCEEVCTPKPVVTTSAGIIRKTTTQ